MESYINLFLKTELTVIPRLLDKYLGDYYNNTLCNGASWMFLTWFALHLIFDDLLNALLRRMRYKEYMRTRLQHCLWYLGFYTTACIYSIATLLRNNISIIHTNEPFDRSTLPSGHLILGFIVVLTFYLHSAFWEKLRNRDGLLASIYLCLCFFLSLSYFLRFIESSFRLTVYISFTQIILELTRCSALMKRDGYKEAIILWTFFFTSLLTSAGNYLILIPTFFAYPLMTDLSPSLAILFVCLIMWWLLELYASVLFKSIRHLMIHKDDKKLCDIDFFECSLFPPRSDATYNFFLLRKEMYEREQQYLAMRKPKNNRNMVFQTLKCMVAIKRKLHDKRQNVNNVNEESVNKEAVESESENSSSTDCGLNQEEIVGGKLEFNINSKETSLKCKQE